jgi:thiosulfate dehydrogenase [quinone] large subunit
MGVSIFVHGAVRIPKLTAAAQGISSQYDETLLEGLPSLIAAYAIPVMEVFIGIGILIGWKLVRYSLASGILLMGILMIGTCLIENWAALPSQIIHAIAFYILLISKYTWQPENENYK